MTKFFVVRLGKDSVPHIETLDALHGKPDAPLQIDLTCAQVPKEFAAGDYALIWLGSDNNAGTDTDWVQGLRAFGKLISRSGGTGHNDTQNLKLEIGFALPRSILRDDFLAKAPTAYFWFSKAPILGLKTHSNQTVQQLKTDDPKQNIKAVFYALEAATPGFRLNVESTYPELKSLFSYTPSSPNATDQTSSDSAEITSIPDTATELPASWILALASKGFLLVSGPSGTGKSKNAREIARAFDYPLETKFASSHNAARPSNSLSFVAVGADWTDGTPLLGFRNMFGSPNTYKDASGKDVHSNERWDSPAALRLMLRATAKPDHPHFLVLDEMNLSHVERYFSDVLSMLEANRGLSSKDKVTLLDAEALRSVAQTLSSSTEFPLEAEVAATLSAAGSGLVLPDNVLIIGTVNVDETTYMFSPKVLDRAHVLEMDIPNVLSYLDGTEISEDSQLSLNECKTLFSRSIQRRRNGFWEKGDPLAIISESVKGTPFETSLPGIKTGLCLILDGLQTLLAPVGFAFAYRTMDEVAAYLATYFECGDPNLMKVGEAEGWQTALDRAVFQKVLPKIHGNRRLLGTSLSAVESFFRGQAATYALGQQTISIKENARSPFTLPRSAKKLHSMIMKLEATGYTTFVN
jgi:hypothetical protein